MRQAGFPRESAAHAHTSILELPLPVSPLIPTSDGCQDAPPLEELKQHLKGPLRSKVPWSESTRRSPS